MPRTSDATVRLRLIERAAAMLTAHEPLTLRGLAAAAGTSTMAVYTHFGGMPGLWRAVRAEAFGRLAARLSAVAPTADPVSDLCRVGVAYVRNAEANPDLYLAMFDNRQGLDDPATADATFQVLVSAVRRARDAGGLAAGTDPTQAATHLWAASHGATTLMLTHALPPDRLPGLLTGMWAAALVGFGVGPDTARRSLRAAWAEAP